MYQETNFWGFFGPHQTPRSSQTRGPIRAVAAGLHHSHSNTTSGTYVTAHGNATVGGGQEWNPRPHGYESGLLPLSHNRNSQQTIFERNNSEGQKCKGGSQDSYAKRIGESAHGLLCRLWH